MSGIAEGYAAGTELRWAELMRAEAEAETLAEWQAEREWRRKRHARLAAQIDKAKANAADVPTDT